MLATGISPNLPLSLSHEFFPISPYVSHSVMNSPHPLLYPSQDQPGALLFEVWNRPRSPNNPP